MIERARDLCAHAGSIVAFSGAGLSAESGVPTFRDGASGTHGEGLWRRYDPLRLASPEGFAADPDLVVSWYGERRRAVARALPNAAHVALAARPDILNVTQNVDDLLACAGARKVVSLHGTLARDRCHAECGFDEAIDLADPPPLRACPRCGALVRPAVVWFGEALPAEAWLRAEKAASTCDAMLVIGTSAEVSPAAGLIGIARSHGARIVIVNTRPTAASAIADLELIGCAGELLPAILRGERGRHPDP